MNNVTKENEQKKTKVSDAYGDGSEFTHYLGNDETKTQESSTEKIDENEIGKVAYGNDSVAD